MTKNPNEVYRKTLEWDEKYARKDRKWVFFQSFATSFQCKSRRFRYKPRDFSSHHARRQRWNGRQKRVISRQLRTSTKRFFRF